MLTPDLPTSGDAGSSPGTCTANTAEMIHHVLCAAPNCAVPLASLPTAFGAEDARPPTTLYAHLANLQDPDMQNLSNYYDIFAIIDSKSATGTLLVFSEDTKKHCYLVFYSASNIQLEPRNHCLSSLEVHCDKNHPTTHTQVHPRLGRQCN